MFDGRLAEDFKLSSGTFVRVGAVRGALVSACGGVLTDAVVAGHDEAFAGALAWVNKDEAARVCGDNLEALRTHLAGCLAKLNEGSGSARRIERLLLMDEPASMDAGEITDKGYVNQRAVLERRAELVARLYAEPLEPSVIVAAG
jgi:feruloyl-CoA synthase